MFLGRIRLIRRIRLICHPETLGSFCHRGTWQALFADSQLGGRFHHRGTRSASASLGNLISLSCLCGTCSIFSSLSVMSAFSPFLATCPFLRAQATRFLTFVYIFRYGWAVGVRREYRAVGGSLTRRVKGKSLYNPLTACVSSLFVFYHLKIVGFLRISVLILRSSTLYTRLLSGIWSVVFLHIIFTSKLKDVCQTSIPTQQ